MKKQKTDCEIKKVVIHKSLGTPKTVGELIEKLQSYDKNTSFGFRNQPMQELKEITINSNTYIVFE